MTPERLLKQYSIVRYDNPNGIYAQSDTDWNELLQAIEALLTEAKIAEFERWHEDWDNRTSEEDFEYHISRHEQLTKQLAELRATLKGTKE